MTDADELIRLGRDFHDAWANSDVVRLDALLAVEYSHVDIYGLKFDRAAWLAYAAESRSPGRLGFEDEEVTVLGDTAVLTSRLLLPEFADAPVIRVIQVWLRTAEGWKRGWYQATIARSRDSRGPSTDGK